MEGMNHFEIYTALAEVDYRREKTARSLRRVGRRWPRVPGRRTTGQVHER